MDPLKFSELPLAGSVVGDETLIGLKPSGSNSDDENVQITVDALTAYVLAQDSNSGGGDALTSQPLSQFASTTSAQLRGVLSDETGTGAAVFATSPTLVTPILGTPTSATLTNATGLPVSTGISGLGSGVATFLATPSSANLAAALTDETGSGAAVFANSPTLITPALGTPSAVVLTNATGLPVPGGGTGVASLTAYAPVFGGTTSTGAVQSGTVGTAGQALTSNGAGALPTFQSQPFDASAYYPGIPTASAVIVRVPIARAVTFPANFSGSYGKASANATGSTAFDIQKNGSSVGTATYSAAGSTATFASSGGTSVSFSAGDVLSIVAPASPDATLADPGFVLAGTR